MSGEDSEAQTIHNNLRVTIVQTHQEIQMKFTDLNLDNANVPLLQFRLRIELQDYNIG